MTKDLAHAGGPSSRRYLNTQDFLSKIDENLQSGDGLKPTPGRERGWTVLQGSDERRLWLGEAS